MCQNEDRSQKGVNCSEQDRQVTGIKRWGLLKEFGACKESLATGRRSLEKAIGRSAKLNLEKEGGTLRPHCTVF